MPPPVVAQPSALTARSLGLENGAFVVGPISRARLAGRREVFFLPAQMLFGRSMGSLTMSMLAKRFTFPAD